MFGHENFGAYIRSIEFLEALKPVVEKLPSNAKHLIDQLSRASSSVPLNIAEGSGKISPRDKRRFYAIARGSALECAAVIDVMRCHDMITPGEAKQLKQLLNEVAAILSAVCLKGVTKGKGGRE